MSVPLTAAQFFEVFRTYNRAIWPMQGIAYLLGLAAIWLALKAPRRAL
jgi:hypothetical protein